MTTPTPIKPLPHKQRGAALIILGLILVLGLITLFTFNMERKTPELEADRKTALALAQAKEALLGWAATDGENALNINPGRLPCQDKDNDGDSEGAACPAINIGRIPWKSLGVSELVDGAAEHLWYVVDVNFRTDDSKLNSEVEPVLTYNNQPIVAAIIAPGRALSALTQNRSTLGTPAPSNDFLNYLEGYSGDPARLTSAKLSDTYNDRVLIITPSELFTVITFRMARDLAASTARPYAATNIAGLTGKSALWSSNDWDSAVEDDGGISNVTSTTVTLKFKHCAIIYKITGPGIVARNPTAC